MSEENKENQNQNPQDQQSGNDKIAKAFEANFKKLLALFKGKDIFKKGKVKNNEVAALVEELVKERREAAAKKFKEEAQKLLDNKIEFDKACKKAEEEFQKTVAGKKKEFTEQMVALFNIVENINEVEKEYYTTLAGGTSGSVEKSE